MQFGNYAPVIIPTLNRYEHLKRCVESLSHCTHADKTELIIGLDYPPSEKYEDGWKMIRGYLPTLTGFKKVTVLNREKNIGAVANMNALIDYACQTYDYFIFTEDDNEFSPCFLDYVNKALIKYWDDERVTAICGFSYPVDMSGYEKNVYFHHDQSAWGLAKWKHKQLLKPEDYLQKISRSFKKRWKVFWHDSRLYYLLIAMLSKRVFWDDAVNGIRNLIEDKYVLYPTVSMCRNHGLDGTGLHSGVSRKDLFLNQAIEEQAVFDIDDIEIKECKDSNLRDYFKLSLRERLVYIKQYLKTVFKK